MGAIDIALLPLRDGIVDVEPWKQRQRSTLRL